MMENKEFLEAVKNQSFVIRYKELSNIINNNINIREKYHKLLALQKKMLLYKDNDLEREYQALYNEILSFPFMEEYFELVNEIESFLNEVKNIIEMEL